MQKDNTLEQRLEAIARAFPGLAQTARLYGAVLPVLDEEEAPVLPDEPSDEEALARLERGIPILEGRDLDVDIDKAMGLLLRLAAAAESAGAPVSVERIRRWIDREHGGDDGAAFQAIISSCEKGGGDSWERRGMDADLCRFLVQAAMKPLLRSWCRKFSAITKKGAWSKGTCPVCGSGPLFAELQGNDQTRHLRCGLCGADWRVRRLSCVHCGNEDHRTLRMLFAATDREGPRIEACDACRTYIKVLPAFTPTAIGLLPAEDLATLNLDAEAQKKGYRRAAETC